jgi:hypothetical protein
MRAIVRDTYGSPDVLELPHQALGFRVQAYGVTQQKDLFSLPENMGEIEPRQLFLDPVWYMPSDDENPVSLLGE